MTGSYTYTEQLTMVIEECVRCGIVFGVTRSYQRQLKDKGINFYCPNGHGQSYTETAEMRLNQKLREIQGQLAQKELEIIAEAKAREVEYRKVKRLEKRMANGVCPCCHRQFIQMTRHMRTKHPEFVKMQS